MMWSLVVAAAVALAALSARGEQVLLLDTTTEATLGWTRFPYGAQASTPGWLEESYTNFEKQINWRSYVVCDVAHHNVNNWLWTPFIERRNANRIYIEIKFTIRDCSLFPGNALSCKETFSLLYYEFDVATREQPPWEPESYKLVGRIAAGEGRFNTNSEVDINTEVKSIAVTKRGVYFAFRDQGACISILAVKVYYITCPEVTVNFARFPATPTGREVTVIEQANGTCVENAETPQGEAPPLYLCKGDGKWTIPTGSCKCRAGFEADLHNQVCNECPPGKFKSHTGDDPCITCPDYSESTAYAAAECKCVPGFFRAKKDPKNEPCTQPPSAPVNLTVTFADQFSISLAWQPPHKTGGRRDITYRVFCSNCGPNIEYRPAATGLNNTRVTVMGLDPVTEYKFQVYAENGVTEQTGEEPKKVEITAVTEASVVSVVSKLRILSVESDKLSLAWNPPPIDLTDPDDTIESYEVKCFPKDNLEKSANATLKITKEPHVIITGLKRDTEYGIRVRAKMKRGWGEFSGIVYARTGSVLETTFVGEEEGAQVRLVAGVMVAVVVLSVVAIIATVLFLRSRTDDECDKKQPSDCNALNYRNGEVYTGPERPAKTSSNATTPLFAGTGSRTYIDPHTYEDPNQAVREFAREIDASCITIEAIIGGGEFGDVCRGKLKLPASCGQEIDVAIKTLKPGSTERARRDFLAEASIMGQFEHPNVIFLQGVVTKCNPIMIITEFMENGSLDTFLRANDGKFRVVQLVGMLRGIATGMQYLSEMNYIHRDLAARNVLVNSQLVCKIADFGLSREIESTADGAYTTRGGKIPVRWTAPEAIAFRKFTSASDVWSMGIVCWEVMSFGERPYWNWSNQDVIKSIEKGYRLPAPMDCPEAVYQLMLDCWQKERTHRPTFASIVKTLDKLIRCPDTLRKIAQNRSADPLAGDTPDLIQFSSVEEWLECIKMSRYIEKFRAAGILDMDAVVDLTVHQLASLGVTLVGHQKKIMNSVQSMRAQIRGSGPYGFLV
ncbi:ephrin type-B receptor 2 [Helicoverpa armigera]|uniref:ephrin type-B receptor 2 n=1 Tax=Helicoverpa armigera TaxID=29058 RepID=UPI000B39B561|nr:ephrin type-B receptor 2 [Helicoverpa armigera]XP_047040253.1 ephrin type-B receptor 2 [Helicoverpa zea]PZC86326.1 hypothetical protein B5X24_HaOG211487 [Helicoverpa armigera]